MKLSIVITTKNRKKKLLRCINSIETKGLEDKDFELIVVDDSSSDGTELLKSSDFDFPNARIFHSQENLMLVKARNLGAKEARGDYVLFIDDDNVVHEDMVTRLIECADSNEDYGILGPSMFFLDSPKLYLNTQKINFFTGRTHGLVLDKESSPIDSDGIPNVFLIKREVFDTCGYFDVKLIQTFTEPDFAFNAKNSGYKCGICKKAITYHDVKREGNWAPRGLGGNWPQKAYCLMRNRTVLVKRYGNFIQKLVYFVLFSWFWPLLYTLLILRFKRFDLIRLYWQGFWDGIKYFFTGNLKGRFVQIK